MLLSDQMAIACQQFILNASLLSNKGKKRPKNLSRILACKETRDLVIDRRQPTKDYVI